MEPVSVAFRRVHLFFGEVSVGVFGPLFNVCFLAVGLSECLSFIGGVSCALPWPVAYLLTTFAFTGRPLCLGLVRSSCPSSQWPCLWVWAWKVIARPCSPGLALFQGPLVGLSLRICGPFGVDVCEGTRSVSRFIFPHLKNLTFQKIFKPIQADYRSEPECTRSPPAAGDWLLPSSASVFTARKHRLVAASSGQTGVPV